MKPPDFTRDELASLIEYHTHSGELFWIVPPPPVPYGKPIPFPDLKPAGTVRSDGTLVVGIKGRKYQAHHLAWYLTTGEWPRSPILFRDKNPANLTFQNLYAMHERYSQTPHARHAREYRERNILRAAERRLERSFADVSIVPGVMFNPTKGKWQSAPPAFRGAVLGFFDTRQEAEEYTVAREVSAQYIKAHPPEPATTINHTTYAGGPEAMTLGEAHNLFCYNPDTGEIAWRRPAHSVGLRADHPNTNGTMVVNFGPRQYPARLVAWFLTHGQWPKRKQLRHRDGNHANYKLENLYLKEDSK